MINNRRSSFSIQAAFLAALVALAWTLPLWAAGTVRMRMVIVNPSSTKTQTTNIKNYLPKEVTLKDIVDNGGLDVEYDEEKEMLYVHKTVELAPSETKTFEIVLNDVWNIPEDRLASYRDRTERTLKKLEESPYFEQADLLAKTILGRLDEVLRTQNDPNATRQQHIAHYRDNLRVLEGVVADLDRLEKLLVTAGGPPNIELMENTEANLKSPTTKTTWVIIFTILIFISILGGAFYFTWQGQTKVTENIFTRESDAAFSDLKGGAKGAAGKSP
jgi:hypothetical protein